MAGLYEQVACIVIEVDNMNRLFYQRFCFCFNKKTVIEQRGVELCKMMLFQFFAFIEVLRMKPACVGFASLIFRPLPV